ncbi:hypothetical protein ACFSDX_03295 [Hymenobacter bucti]|uniref:Uncharacterized protein n=1 Tax=Hymenobacter bucti TaxID=1844114 RepID=A0ABW4QQ22_9BACT
MLEQVMATKIKATTLTLQASHVPLPLLPQKAADLIAEAVKAPAR